MASLHLKLTNWRMACGISEKFKFGKERIASHYKFVKSHHPFHKMSDVAWPVKCAVPRLLFLPISQKAVVVIPQAELTRFIHIAGGSVSELEYQLILAHGLGYVSDEMYPELNSEINKIKRMLNGFEKAVQVNSKKSKV